MKKSFYYVIDRKIMFEVFATLNAMQIPFEVERIGWETAIVFPDLCVMQYSFVLDLFGSPGVRYK